MMPVASSAEVARRLRDIATYRNGLASLVQRVLARLAL